MKPESHNPAWITYRGQKVCSVCWIVEKVVEIA